MTGVMIVTHGNLGQAFVESMEMIVGPQEGVESLSLQVSDDTDKARRRLEKAVRRLDAGDGVLIFTDMLGGTPSNLCLSLLGRMNVEVISGVNLPLLLKALHLRAGGNLVETAARVQSYAGESVKRASDVLRPGGAGGNAGE